MFYTRFLLVQPQRFPSSLKLAEFEYVVVISVLIKVCISPASFCLELIRLSIEIGEASLYHSKEDKSKRYL